MTKAIYRRACVLDHENSGEKNAWQISFHTMFHMTNDAALFRDSASLKSEGLQLEGNIYEDRRRIRYIPLYEAKMAYQYDHRFGTYEGRSEARESTALDTPTTDEHQDPEFVALPRYWVSEADVSTLVPSLSIRDISHATNERSLIAQIIPPAAVGNSLMLVRTPNQTDVSLLYATFCSFVFDFVVRQKMGGLHLNFFILKQLPLPAPAIFSEHPAWVEETSQTRDWVSSRVLELTYTAWDLESFAQDCGFSDPPFRWDEDRRFLLRCELDAAFFHLYLPTDTNGDWCPTERETAEDFVRLKASFPTPRDAVAYIMDTFPIVRRKDEAKYDGDYRTKRVILVIYDAMQDAIRTGQPYQTRLDPPPADPSCCHPPRDAIDPGDSHAS